MEYKQVRVKRGRRTVFRILGGSAVILLLMGKGSGRSDPIFDLGAAGTFFWKTLDDEPSLAEIITRFGKKFGLKKKEAAQTVTKLVSNLRKEKLIEVKKPRQTRQV